MVQDCYRWTACLVCDQSLVELRKHIKDVRKEEDVSAMVSSGGEYWVLFEQFLQNPSHCKTGATESMKAMYSVHKQRDPGIKIIQTVPEQTKRVLEALNMKPCLLESEETNEKMVAYTIDENIIIYSKKMEMTTMSAQSDDCILISQNLSSRFISSLYKRLLTFSDNQEITTEKVLLLNAQSNNASR
ncbi:hypothetical protein MAM1_0071c04181 [Mucor ambiguus]|uniref:Uncharacterized protein n=1 Tax=Mucor ambiguus TaxID=91626 RepID=A0A0C9MNF9_9FUNG|nr:hypothetical protein MAM1_0071c04181 [Mucor ambiguus]